MRVTVVTGFPHYPTGNVRKHLRKKALSIENMDSFKVVRTFVPPLPARGLANRMILFIVRATKVIEGKYGIPESKIHVVRGGVDISKFKPIPCKDDGKFTVLYSGAFSVAYDFDQVLKAAEILEKHEDLEIVLQGGGELLNYVKQRVAEMKDMRWFAKRPRDSSLSSEQTRAVLRTDFYNAAFKVLKEEYLRGEPV